MGRKHARYSQQVGIVKTVYRCVLHDFMNQNFVIACVNSEVCEYAMVKDGIYAEFYK